MSEASTQPENPGTSNHEKYTVGAQNPIVRRLMDRLFDRVRAELATLSVQRLLDAGCGEGHAMQELAHLLPNNVVGFDINPDAVAFCQAQHPDHTFTVESIYELPYEDGQFDAVVCMEVLEHLDDPATALRELSRVCRGHLILSVPFEPWFQLGNLARGKYREHWGNHPEHVQHWGPRSVRKFLEANPALSDVRVREAWPWIVAVATSAGKA